MALLHVDFFSRVLTLDVRMDVILPEPDKGQIGMAGKDDGVPIRTLYLLHGMSDDHTIWQRRTSIERYAAERGIAVIMPTTELGWYTDMHMGPKYFTFLTEELPKICRNMFPRLSKRREDTFVCGLSMGGYGAIKCALRAPEVFSKGASLSGALDAAAHAKRGLDADVRVWKGYWTDVFGPDPTGSVDDLYAAAEEMKDSPLRPDLYMWCGTEDYLYKQNTAYRDHLRKLGYNLKYEEDHGIHAWQYWDKWVINAMDFMLGEAE